jgi:hypothetical protein
MPACSQCDGMEAQWKPSGSNQARGRNLQRYGANVSMVRKIGRQLAHRLADVFPGPRLQGQSRASLLAIRENSDGQFRFGVLLALVFTDRALCDLFGGSSKNPFLARHRPTFRTHGPVLLHSMVCALAGADVSFLPPPCCARGPAPPGKHFHSMQCTVTNWATCFHSRFCFCPEFGLDAHYISMHIRCNLRQDLLSRPPLFYTCHQIDIQETW